MFEKMTAKQLRAAIKKIGESKVQAESGIASSTLNNFVTGDTDGMRRVSHEKLIDALYRLSGRDGLPTGPTSAISSIPIYDIRASAGAGALVEDGEPTGYQPFREPELARFNPADLAVIQVGGDSMWETLHDGDKVLVNRAEKRIVKPGIYILAYEGTLIVKRCQRNLETGAVIVQSDNPDYETFTVTDADVLDVIGRVVWIGRALG